MHVSSTSHAAALTLRQPFTVSSYMQAFRQRLQHELASATPSASGISTFTSRDRRGALQKPFTVSSYAGLHSRVPFRQRLQHELATRQTIFGFGDVHLHTSRDLRRGSPAETNQVDRQAARHRQTEVCTPRCHAASGQNLASNRLDAGKAPQIHVL